MSSASHSLTTLVQVFPLFTAPLAVVYNLPGETPQPLPPPPLPYNTFHAYGCVGRTWGDYVCLYGCIFTVWRHLAELDGQRHTLRLDLATLGRIFSGEITHWRHPAIMQLNTDLADALPEQDILVRGHACASCEHLRHRPPRRLTLQCMHGTQVVAHGESSGENYVLKRCDDVLGVPARVWWGKRSRKGEGGELLHVLAYLAPFITLATTVDDAAAR